MKMWWNYSNVMLLPCENTSWQCEWENETVSSWSEPKQMVSFKMVSGLKDPPPFLLPGDQLLQSGGHLLVSGLSLLCRLSFPSLLQPLEFGLSPFIRFGFPFLLLLCSPPHPFGASQLCCDAHACFEIILKIAVKLYRTKPECTTQHTYIQTVSPVNSLVWGLRLAPIISYLIFIMGG